MEKLFHCNKTIQEVNQMSPLTWAYVGDGVYELYIRTYLVHKTNVKPHKLHAKAIRVCKSTCTSRDFKDVRNRLNRRRKRNCSQR